MVRHLQQSPLQILLHSWPRLIDAFLFRDMVVNIAIYVPLGMAGHLAFRKYKAPLLSFYGPVLLGFLLSCCMEMAQVFEPSRITSLLDVFSNVVGSVLGVVAGVVFEKIATGAGTRLAALRPLDRSALSLLFAWAAFFLFPFFPLMSLYQLRARVQVFLHAPVLAVVPLISMAALWFAAGRLLQAVGVGAPRVWLAVGLMVLPAQFLIEERQPLPSEVVGALMGSVLFSILSRSNRVTAAEALGFVVVLIVRGLAPFHFVAQSNGFGWLPFSGLLATQWQRGLLLLLQKALFYGIAVWLLRAAGMSLAWATAVVAVVLLGIEVAQVHLPGRTSEIMDPLLAVLIGFALGVLQRSGRRGALALS